MSNLLEEDERAKSSPSMKTVKWWLIARKPDGVAHLDEIEKELFYADRGFVRKLVEANLSQMPEGKLLDRKVTFEAPTDVAKGLVNYWRERVPGRKKSRVTAKRVKKVQARLKDGFSPKEIRAAIDALAKSPFHNGENDRSTLYNDIELICRNTEKLEHWVLVANRRPSSGGIRSAARGRR